MTTNELLHSEIYPALFHVLPEALPEFEFTRKADCYRSTNTLKANGEPGDAKGKVEVREGSPSWLNDRRGYGCSIWDYVQQRDGLDTPGAVIRRLAELAQITLPEQQLSPDEARRIEQANFDAKLWEVVNGFFIDCLDNGNNPHANSDRASQIRKYLTLPIDQGGRGYSTNLIQKIGQATDRDAPRMELGYIPGVNVLREYLLSVGFTHNEIFSLINGLEASPDGRIGTTNILTFPYRDHAGRIRGMVFRSLSGGDFKYLYSTGLKRSGILFNLRAVSKGIDLTIVESPLDAIHATALGIKNITALGGSGDTLNKTQVDLAIKYGARRITLMLDNDGDATTDRAGTIGTDKAVAFLQQNYPNLRVFVGEYPEGVKDLDELLHREGVEGYDRVKAMALESWRYQLTRTFARYNRLAAQTGEYTAKQVADLLDEVVNHAANLPALDREMYIKAFTDTPGIGELGVSPQSIADAANKIRSEKDKDARTKSVQSLLSEAEAKLKKGDELAAIELLEAKSRTIKQNDSADRFAELTGVTSLQQLKDRMRNRPPALETGFSIDGNPLLIAPAAISILAGGTSHGKSILIANLALNLARLYPDKTFHIFSYEVDQDQYLADLLNTYIGDEQLAFNNRESINHYLRGIPKVKRKSSGNEYGLFRENKESVFTAGLARFFAELIETGRIKVHYVTYDSDALIDAIRHLNRTESVGAVLVDYVQLIYTPPGKLRNPSRQEEIKQMCIDFKDAAIETGLPLVFAAQFNREVQNLAQMHATKLGEAGDLERIANLIVGVWNNGRKNGGTPSKAEQAVIDERGGSEPDPNTWYVEILKRRGGKVEVWDIWDYSPNAAKVTSRQ